MVFTSVSETTSHKIPQIDYLVARLLTYKTTPANLDLAFRSLSLEIITTYCFARSSHALDAPNFQSPILSAIDHTLPMIWVFKHFPLIQKVLLSVPECFASVLKPSTVGILEQRKMMGEQIDEIMKDPSSLHGVGHETIYHHFLNPGGEENSGGSSAGEAGESKERHEDTEQHLPPLSRQYLLDEGLYMRFAGSDTVGNACTVALYYILTNSHVRKRLLEELMEIWPDKDLSIGYEKLEKLSYLVSSHGIL